MNKITLNDVLKCDVDESKIQDITLVGNIVSVYEYDASKPDGKGAPVSKTFIHTSIMRKHIILV